MTIEKLTLSQLEQYLSKAAWILKGPVMDNLFEYRNEMEHPVKNDPKSPGKQMFFQPNYRRIKKKIEKTLPKALNSFDDAYKEHYT